MHLNFKFTCEGLKVRDKIGSKIVLGRQEKLFSQKKKSK